MKLMLGNVWRRELIMLVLCVIAVFQYAKIGQRPLFSDVMQGISDFRGNPYFPMSWFLIVIFNQVVIGDSFRKLILHDYPLVASISLGRYLFCSVLNLFSVGGANVLLLLVMTRHHSLHFAWTAAFCLPDADFSARNLRRASRHHCGFDNFCRRDAVFWPVDVCQRNGDFARGCFGSIADADHHRLVRF